MGGLNHVGHIRRRWYPPERDCGFTPPPARCPGGCPANGPFGRRRGRMLAMRIRRGNGAEAGVPLELLDEAVAWLIVEGRTG